MCIMPGRRDGKKSRAHYWEEGKVSECAVCFMHSAGQRASLTPYRPKFCSTHQLIVTLLTEFTLKNRIHLLFKKVKAECDFCQF
jgi:hypothetical protein